MAHNMDLKLEKMEYKNLVLDPERIYANDRLFMEGRLCKRITSASLIDYLPSAIRETLFESLTKIEDSCAKKTSLAFKGFEKYALNLILKPWKKDYTIIKKYSGYYCSIIAPNVMAPERLLYQLGYEEDDDSSPAAAANQTSISMTEGEQFVLKERKSTSFLFETAFYCYVASLECDVLALIKSKIEFPCTYLRILQERVGGELTTPHAPSVDMVVYSLQSKLAKLSVSPVSSLRSNSGSGEFRTSGTIDDDDMEDVHVDLYSSGGEFSHLYMDYSDGFHSPTPSHRPTAHQPVDTAGYGKPDVARYSPTAPHHPKPDGARYSPTAPHHPKPDGARYSPTALHHPTTAHQPINTSGFGGSTGRNPDIAHAVDYYVDNVNGSHFGYGRSASTDLNSHGQNHRLLNSNLGIYESPGKLHGIRYPPQGQSLTSDSTGGPSSSSNGASSSTAGYPDVNGKSTSSSSGHLGSPNSSYSKPISTSYGNMPSNKPTAASYTKPLTATAGYTKPPTPGYTTPTPTGYTKQTATNYAKPTTASYAKPTAASYAKVTAPSSSKTTTQSSFNEPISSTWWCTKCRMESSLSNLHCPSCNAENLNVLNCKRCTMLNRKTDRICSACESPLH